MHLILRILYFLFFGIWFSALWATVAWVLCVTIVGLPVGLWMLNRLPQVTTLQPQRELLVVSTTGEIYRQGLPQVNVLIRALWFVLVGWWFSALWLSVAWALCTVIIGMPFGFWMFNRVPAIITLARI
ncbi:MAG: YccF domain-containing protein [Candidatus Viridilinea halotolerans]|uniref:YccF domain-containing protein n=1 Tax=Candidatus Viridilinea halotolerans TaxID=2491704 RepID=A0A426U709_9CHLR|nr:MAG: YccF domain-containing protein [Candidatus Viridilinea halotolerans]